MAKFIRGNELNTEVEKILETAEEQIILISPYIKLHDRYASVLKTKKTNPKLEITVVFGKNEEDISRSMKQDDFEFFKEFPNIEIRYEKQLHAKYYSNEASAILTSMNLYSYSQDNNIEAGVLTKSGLLGRNSPKFISDLTTSDNVDSESSAYFSRVIEQSELLFKKVPEYEKGDFIGLTKKYKTSNIETDKLSDFFANRNSYETKSNKSSYEKPKYEAPKYDSPKPKTDKTGYCIRTGKPIPFNTEKPMCDEAFQSWSKFSNEDYPEKFCHFSGESSNGETSKAKPILKKNWKLAKDTFNL